MKNHLKIMQQSSMKNKILQKLLLLFLFVIVCKNTSNADEYIQDTIYTKWFNEDIFDVKFLKNDEIISLNGHIFINSENGEIFKTIENADNKKFVWFETDKSFIIHNNNKKIDYIYNIDNFEIIDSIVGINCLPFTAPHKRIFADTIDNRVRIWDYESKKIIKTIQFENIPNISRYVIIPTFSQCDDFNFYTGFSYFTKPNPPFEPNGTSGYELFRIDLETFEIKDTLTKNQSSPLKYFQDQIITSKDCSNYYYVSNGNLEVHDYQSSELLKKIDLKGNSISKFCISDDNHFLVGIGNNKMTCVDLLKGEVIYSNKDGSFFAIDISKSNKYICATISNFFIKYKTRFINTSVSTQNVSPNVLYPNPTNNKVTIGFNSTISNVQFTIVKQNGEILKNEFIKAEIGQLNSLELDFSEYPSGVYFINLITGENLPQTIKIVKE